jgi:hypothetical protein
VYSPTKGEERDRHAIYSQPALKVYVRAMTEDKTRNMTIGWIDSLSWSTCSVLRSEAPSGRLVFASVPMNTAPTPIGPNQPVNAASRRVLISGIHLYRARMTGRRRKRSTQRARTTKRHTETYHQRARATTHFVGIKLVKRHDRADVDEGGTVE